MAQRLVLLGPPGAGKGTQATWLAEMTGILHVSTGDLVRAAIAAGSPLGRTMQSYHDRGELVPDQLIIDLVTPYLAAAQGWVLDGFPRDVAQAEALDAALATLGLPLERVVALQIPDELLVERLGARRLSSATGTIYNLLFDPPPPDDPGPLIQRADDHPDEIRRRLQIYHAQTEPLLAYYDVRGLLRTVDAGGPIQSVHERIMDALAG